MKTTIEIVGKRKPLPIYMEYGSQYLELSREVAERLIRLLKRGQGSICWLIDQQASTRLHVTRKSGQVILVEEIPIVSYNREFARYTVAGAKQLATRLAATCLKLPVIDVPGCEYPGKII